VSGETPRLSNLSPFLGCCAYISVAEVKEKTGMTSPYRLGQDIRGAKSAVRVRLACYNGYFA
jgi:hypothetical protein